MSTHSFLSYPQFSIVCTSSPSPWPLEPHTCRTLSTMKRRSHPLSNSALPSSLYIHAIVDVSLFPFPSSGLLASRRILLLGVRTHASFTASPLSFDADFFFPLLMLVRSIAVSTLACRSSGSSCQSCFPPPSSYPVIQVHASSASPEAPSASVAGRGS